MSEIEMPNTYLPDEIVRDILSRLPVKSLLQLRSVSKHWRDLITGTSFIKSHLEKALTSLTNHRILLPTYPLLSMSYNPSPNNINESVILDCSFLNSRTSIKILGSCNGLVCLIDGTRDIIIYNPSTRKHFQPLESPQQVLHCSNRIEFVYGLGCSSDPNDIRIIRFPRFARDSDYNKLKVCDKVTNSWRNGLVSSCYDFINTVGTYLNGSLHWLAYCSGNDDDHRIVASFDISEETFTDISLPHQNSRLPCYVLGVLQGCLSAVCDDICYTEVEVWLMKEYGVVDSWVKFIKIPLNMGGIENISYMMPLGCLNDDEILLEIDLQSFVIYDAKKKRFRRVMNAHDLKLFGDAKVYVESLLSPEVSCVLY